MTRQLTKSRDLRQNYLCDFHLWCGKGGLVLIDLVQVNGRLKFGQTIILAGTEGPIVTTVKALLTPAKMQDLRVKVSITQIDTWSNSRQRMLKFRSDTPIGYCTVADPDPGSSAFLTPGPGSGIQNKFFPDLGSRIPTQIFESLVTIEIFGKKVLYR